MKKVISILLILIWINNYAQEESNKRKPIIFTDGSFGFASGSEGEIGATIGANVYLQNKKDLFSIRSILYFEVDTETIFISPFTPIPIISVDRSNYELGALYGKRFIFGGSRSVSVSAGISYNWFNAKLTNESNEMFNDRNQYLGVPFEIAFKLFKSEKQRYRVLSGLIPVGKETGFGRNFGMKFIGSISQNGYFSIAFTYGLGVNKFY